MSVFEWDKKQWTDFVKRVRKSIGPETQNKVLAATAQEGVAILKDRMPVRTGETKNKWFAIEKGRNVYSIFNTSKVALFLEEGTKAHGPKKAKFLYIPLRRGIKVWRKGQVYGRDYILAKWVKGIKALKYLKPASNAILNNMVNRFMAEMRGI